MFVIGESLPKNITLSTYTQFPSCAGDQLEQSYYVDGVLNPAFSWLDINSTDITISTDNFDDIGNYTVTIKVSYTSLEYVYSDTQSVIVLISRLNTAPYFVEQVPPSFELQVAAAWLYTLP
jgi:hypothetical protein